MSVGNGLVVDRDRCVVDVVRGKDKLTVRFQGTRYFILDLEFIMLFT